MLNHEKLYGLSLSTKLERMQALGHVRCRLVMDFEAPHGVD
jgi:hypothetical protein